MLVSSETKTATMKTPKRILLIDHEPGVTRLVRQALEKAGKYLVQEEHDDQAALQAARSFQPDLILLDTPATSPNGQVLERQIQTDALLRDTPLLRLSSLKSESQMVSGGVLSGYSFFAAPIRIEEVLRGVEDLLFRKDCTHEPL
jgi:PleD family two-component response regulator